MGFLDLPLSVRRLIYDYAGLVGQTIDLNISNLLVYPYQQHPDSTHAVRLRCARPELVLVRNRDATASSGQEEYWELKSNERSTKDEEYRLLSTHRCSGCVDGRGLMFTCKEIACEVVPFVYANNNFIVRQESPHGLKRVDMMGLEAIRALKSLTVKLDLLEGRVQVATHSVDKLPLQPLHLYERSSRSNFEDYTMVIKHLSENIRPDKLSLNLIFCVACCRMLDDVLHSLFQLPRLKKCTLWTFFGLGDPALFMERHHGPYGLSYTTPEFKTIPTSVKPPSAQITSHCTKTRSGFRYLDLPAELRLQILGYTDLVSAEGVQWRPQPEELVTGHCTCKPCHKRSWHSNAVTYDPSVEMYYDDYFEDLCYDLPQPTPSTPMCFFPKNDHLRSATCLCPTAQHALFSVSRAVREDATAVYYSLNRIFITPLGSPTFSQLHLPYAPPWPPPGGLYEPRIELSLYLSSLRRGALQHVRWLEWIVPHTSENYLAPNTPAWFDYVDTLDMMRHAMNIPTLTFVLNMGADQDYVSGKHWYYHGLVELWKWYARIALELQRLGPLKNCFIYLSRTYSDVAWRGRLETSLEKDIMGDEYDSAQRGKPTERISAIVGNHRRWLF